MNHSDDSKETETPETVYDVHYTINFSFTSIKVVLIFDPKDTANTLD